MKSRILTLACLVLALSAVFSTAVTGQRRRAVVRRPAPVRRALVIHHRHPIRRVLPKEVVVRTARRTVVVNAPRVYAPVVTWTPAVASLPELDVLVWQDTGTIENDEGWVDMNFGVDSLGNALFLDVNGRAQISFAEVTFANGNVQVLDFNERTHGSGVYRLFDFADGRHVSTVRLLAKSESDEAKLAVYLSK